MKFTAGWGGGGYGSNHKIFCGGGMDILWDNTMWTYGFSLGSDYLLKVL